MWVLTEYIGYDGHEELYVFVPSKTVETEEEAERYNQDARQYGSGRLHYYHAERLPNSESLPPGRIITEHEALYYRDEPVENWSEYVAWLNGEETFIDFSNLKGASSE